MMRNIKQNVCCAKNVLNFVVDVNGAMLYGVNTMENLNILCNGVDVSKKFWLMIEVNGIAKSIEFLSKGVFFIKFSKQVLMDCN